MSEIPQGWVLQPDGSYSKPKTGQYAACSVPPPVKNTDKETGCITFKEKKPRRIRQDSKPLMNGLETEYHRILCEKYGEPFVKPQALRFKLANGLWYKPDFTVFSTWLDHMNEKVNGQIICYEVKGPFAFRGGFENLKSAAFQWPQVQFILVWKKNGIWQHQEILK
jgi:hypothetical protein